MSVFERRRCFLVDDIDQFLHCLQVIHQSFYILDQLLGINHLKRTSLPNIAFVKHISVLKALFNTPIDQMNKLRPLHEYFILETFWQYLFHLLCHMGVFELAQYLIFNLKLLHISLHLLMN